jgi:hypothetical protein
MGFHNLVNTAQFSYTARDWKVNGGRYTTAPKGSRDYFQFWEQEDYRCKMGYKCGDVWIPGRMYFYLNYTPMSRVPDSVLMKTLEQSESGRKGTVSKVAIEKIIDFPKFWEISYEWWNFKHIAWYGGEFMGIQSPGNKHLCALKTRGAGFSYMEAADGVYNYNFIPGSKSYYFAGAEPFLVGDAIMDKVQGGLDWINKYCSYWKQNRQVKKSVMHQRASYLDSYGVEKGTFSEIIAQTVDKASKTRGKRGRKATFEEGGSFPVLEDALEVSLGSLREGSMYVGQASVFGTGGEQGPGIQGLENIFYNPEAWDMLQFFNIWEDGYQGTECGYFVPCWRADTWHMDVNGNVDVQGAIAADNEQRRKKKKSGKPKDLDRRKAEYPRNPAEALQRLTGNGFNVAEIDAQIKRIQTSTAIQAMVRYGFMVRDEKGVDFTPRPKHVARPIEDYPHKQDELTKGCVSILERPYTDPRGKVPDGLYRITVDTYYKEESTDQTSLWSLKVWKLDNNVDTSFMGLPVAWYVGRPTRYEDNHDITFMLSEFYNAKIQGEIAGGGQSIVSYAKTHKKLHMICNEPEMAHNKELASKSAGNSFLMNMNGDRKKLGIMYLEDWHVKPRGVDENGKIVLNIHRIYDIGFLREMRKFNPEKGNFDRISDAIVAMFELKDNYAIQVKKKIKDAQNSFYNRKFYSDSEAQDSGVTSAY